MISLKKEIVMYSDVVYRAAVDKASFSFVTILKGEIVDAGA